mgnify:CR=1 FL=1
MSSQDREAGGYEKERTRLKIQKKDYPMATRKLVAMIFISYKNEWVILLKWIFIYISFNMEEWLGIVI